MHFSASIGNNFVANNRNFGASLSKSVVIVMNFFDVFDELHALSAISLFAW